MSLLGFQVIEDASAIDVAEPLLLLFLGLTC